MMKRISFATAAAFSLCACTVYAAPDKKAVVPAARPEATITWLCGTSPEGVASVLANRQVRYVVTGDGVATMLSATTTKAEAMKRCPKPA